MSPPKLARYTPIFDVFHPVPVNIFLTFWEKTQLHHPYGFQWDQTKCPCQHTTANDNLGSTTALVRSDLPYIVLVIFYIDDMSGFLNPLKFLSHNESILTQINCGIVTHCTIRIENINNFQLMSFSYLVVIDIMSRSYLQCSGTKFTINIIVKMIGISLLIIGTIAFLPFNHAYLSSSGCTAIAVSPGMVSGLVVAMVTYEYPQFDT